MKIIVDTNLWISFLIGKKLSMLKILFTHPGLTIYVSDQLIEEFKEVSSRNKIRKYISEQDILETIKLIDLHCCYFNISKVAVSPIRDVKDLFLLSLSDRIPADYIVTGDKDLLILQNHNQTKIVTYSVFMSLLKEHP